MRSQWWRIGALLVIAVATCPAWTDEARRNPFEVDDVVDPTGEDVKQFADSIKLKGGADDKNAEQWVTAETAGKKGSLDGDWSGRWGDISGTTKIKTVKDRVYILYTDVVCGVNGTTYLLEAVRDKNKLVGRWVAVDNADAKGPFVGLIVDDERIDGAWGEDLRWDFRRKLKK